MYTKEKILEILEAYDLTKSFRRGGEVRAGELLGALARERRVLRRHVLGPETLPVRTGAVRVGRHRGHRAAGAALNWTGIRPDGVSLRRG